MKRLIIISLSLIMAGTMVFAQCQQCQGTGQQVQTSQQTQTGQQTQNQGEESQLMIMPNKS